MLKLIDVCKSYKYGKNRVLVLDKINLDFKKQELVFILGESGSGKSTLLNIIGGILEVDNGKVMLDDKDITKFNNDMLCNYRNNMIGYIFQDYHLIEYMSVMDNIKLGMTVKNQNSNRLEEVLKKLGIYSKRKVIVNKLSGGEKQRVAIARAIINNPDIILCDEPTGALDSSNSIKIMNILKEISREKLVIVVSHDTMLANEYADRIVNIVDGKVNYYPQIDDNKFNKIENTKISLLRIIKLAIKNLGLKKGRTFFTSLAISISFLSLLLVLCLAKSFNDDIRNLEREIVSMFPISIYNGEYEVIDDNVISSNDKIIRKEKNDYIHTNIINNDYLDYLKEIDVIKDISYHYDISMPLISDRYNYLDNVYMKTMPSSSFIYNNYDVLYGDVPDSFNEIVLKISSNNNVDSELLDVFNIDSNIMYKDLIGRKIRVILNDLYYVKNGDYYFINSDYEKIYKESEIELEIVGIIKEKEVVNDNNFFYYDGKLVDYVIDGNINSEIVKNQIDMDKNILGINMEKDKMLSYLGYKTIPNGIDIYIYNLDDKEIVLNKLDEYNNNHDKLIYVDTMSEAINIIKNVINIITVILVIFCLISTIVSSMMIFILTNNKVMERIKEIGILRSLGARNNDIVRLFNIENIIIGIISSILGIVMIWLLFKPINLLLLNFLEDDGVFKIYSNLVIFSVLFNILIVVLSGYIPTLIASKKRIVDCIYNRV